MLRFSTKKVLLIDKRRKYTQQTLAQMALECREFYMISWTFLNISEVKNNAGFLSSWNPFSNTEKQSQLACTCSKTAVETPEKSVKYVQS